MGTPAYRGRPSRDAPFFCFGVRLRRYAPIGGEAGHWCWTGRPPVLGLRGIDACITISLWGWASLLIPPPRNGGPAFFLAVIHPSAWKGCSANFGRRRFSEVRTFFDI